MKLDSFASYQRHTTDGLLWVIGAQCADSGSRYLFKFAYDQRPEQAILHRLEGDQSNPYDRAENCIRDLGQVLCVRRPLGASLHWLILE